MPFAEVIMNPSAGNARWKKQLPELVAIIESHFAPLHISQTRKAGDARLVTERLIKAYQHKMDDLQLIVIGGDGTLHDVVNGLQRQGHPEVAIGYVPTGTGDDFARANHIPLDPKKAAAALTTAMPHALKIGVADSAKYGTQYFINNFGIGMDAQIVYQTNHSDHKAALNALKLGHLSYAASILKALRQQKKFPATWQVDGQGMAIDDAYLNVFPIIHSWVAGCDCSQIKQIIATPCLLSRCIAKNWAFCFRYCSPFSVAVPFTAPCTTHKVRHLNSPRQQPCRFKLTAKNIQPRFR